MLTLIPGNFSQEFRSLSMEPQESETKTGLNGWKKSQIQTQSMCVLKETQSVSYQDVSLLFATTNIQALDIHVTRTLKSVHQ